MQKYSIKNIYNKTIPSQLKLPCQTHNLCDKIYINQLIFFYKKTTKPNIKKTPTLKNEIEK